MWKEHIVGFIYGDLWKIENMAACMFWLMKFTECSKNYSLTSKFNNSYNTYKAEITDMLIKKIINFVENKLKKQLQLLLIYWAVLPERVRMLKLTCITGLNAIQFPTFLPLKWGEKKLCFEVLNSAWVFYMVGVTQRGLLFKTELYNNY